MPSYGSVVTVVGRGPDELSRDAGSSQEQPVEHPGLGGAEGQSLLDEHERTAEITLGEGSRRLPGHSRTGW